MSEKRAIKRNMAWNTAGLTVETVTGFLVMPFLVVHLGQVTYGVWLVLGALTGYFGVLDLGIRGSIGRHVALYHANLDRAGIDRTVTAGLGVLLLTGTAGLATLLGLQPLFFDLFEIPAGQHEAVVTAYRLVAAQFGIFLLGSIFDAILWGLQRFDWLNMVDIPAALLRLGLTFLLVRSDGDLVRLAWISLSITAASGLVKGLLCVWADPGLRIRPTHLHRSAIRELLGFGVWTLLSNVARLSRRQLILLLIGSLLGVASVVPFTVADRLLGATAAVLAAVTGVLTPYATGLHATNRREQQVRLFVNGGRHAAALATLLTTSLLVLGGPLIALWVGPAMAPAGSLLVVLALGELLPSTQYVSNSLLVATGRHRATALLGIVEAALVGLLAVLLIPHFGLVGAGWAVAGPAVLARGVVPLVLGCQQVGLPARSFITGVITPVILCAVVPAAVARTLLLSLPAASWPSLAAYSALYTVLFVTGYAVVIGRQVGVRARSGLSNSYGIVITEESPSEPSTGVFQSMLMICPSNRQGINAAPGRPTDVIHSCTRVNPHPADHLPTGSEAGENRGES